MPSQRESLVVKAIERAIKLSYPTAWVWKVHGDPYGTGGVPDIIACVEGRLVGIEVKDRRGQSDEAVGKRVTLRQRAALARIHDAGGIAGVATSPEEALAILRPGLEHY